MSEPKFTKEPLTPFRVEREKGRFDIGLEDSELTVLCYTAGGNPDTRMANVTLWSMAGEMYGLLLNYHKAISKLIRYRIKRFMLNDYPVEEARFYMAQMIEEARQIKNVLKKARGER